MTQPHPDTSAVRTGIESDTQHGAVVPPLYLSSNFAFEAYGTPRRYDYTRSGNPTRDALADALAGLEGGAGAVITGSGMSAIALVLQLVEPGKVVRAPHDCYGGTFRLLQRLAARGQFDLELVDQSNAGAVADSVERHGERLGLIWVETPSNPLLRITDLEAVCGHARRAGALVACDNTFLSPALQTPIRFGADLVVHSTTKYLNGHSDVVGGAVIARNDELAALVTDWANCLGLTGAPFDSYLTLRGVRTLAARIRIHQENAAAVCALLDADPRVTTVYYPGLASHPGHATAARQQSGFGGMVSFDLDPASVSVSRFVESLTHFSLAESLGGVESLVCHPATMTHAPMDVEARRAAGIGDHLVRLSVGIEHGDDLVRDLSRALDLATATKSGRVAAIG